MLSKLHVKNFVLIDSLEIDFPEGLVIITGQTGAGKSILLGALSLVMGSKADAGMLSDGADNCVVEAVFEVGGQDEGLQLILDENDIESDEGHLIFVSDDKELQPMHMLVVIGGAMGCLLALEDRIDVYEQIVETSFQNAYQR